MYVLCIYIYMRLPYLTLSVRHSVILFVRLCVCLSRETLFSVSVTHCETLLYDVLICMFYLLSINNQTDQRDKT
jgi:hypothetical protein